MLPPTAVICVLLDSPGRRRARRFRPTSERPQRKRRAHAPALPDESSTNAARATRSRQQRSSIAAPRSLNDPVGERYSSLSSKSAADRASGQSKLIVGVPPCPSGNASQRQAEPAFRQPGIVDLVEPAAAFAGRSSEAGARASHSRQRRWCRTTGIRRRTLSDVVEQQIGNFHRREVAALRELGPANDVEGALAPRPRRQRRASLELDESGWDFGPPSLAQANLTADFGFNLRRRPRRLVVDPHRRGLCPREPVDRDGRQQFVLAEASIEVAASGPLVLAHDVGQDPPLVDDPGQQPNGRVLEVEGHGLELGPVDAAMRRVVADVWLLLLGEETALLLVLGSAADPPGGSAAMRHVNSRECGRDGAARADRRSPRPSRRRDRGTRRSPAATSTRPTGRRSPPVRGRPSLVCPTSRSRAATARSRGRQVRWDRPVRPDRR